MTDQPMTPVEFARALGRYWPPYGDDDELVVRGELLAAYRALWERVNVAGPTLEAKHTPYDAMCDCGHRFVMHGATKHACLRCECQRFVNVRDDEEWCGINAETGPASAVNEADTIEQHSRGCDVPDEIATHFPYAEWLVNRHLDHVTGPASAVNASDSDAWELSRRDCPCKDCKGKGNLPCDECGVTG